MAGEERGVQVDLKRRTRTDDVPAPADNEAAAAHLKAVSEGGREMRSDLRTKERTGQSRAPSGSGTTLHVLPIGENVNYIEHDAVQHLAQADERAREQNEALRAREVEVYLFFVRCEHGHHGLYLKDRPSPSKPITPDGWYSRQKPTLAEPRPLRIVCQVCAMQNRETELPIEQKYDGSFVPEMDRVYRVPKDAKRARAEGETPAFKSKYVSNNSWIEEVREKANKAGYDFIEPE